MIWLTADHHFGHRNVIRYCDRPFTDTLTMQTALICNHNTYVSPNDLVYFLGDFSFHKTDHTQWLLSQMYGEKILIKGNHDRLTKRKYLNVGFSEVKDRDYIDDTLLVHNPADNYFNCKCICGHVHEKWTIKDNCVNVGVDRWEFRPVSLEKVKGIFNELSND